MGQGSEHLLLLDHSTNVVAHSCLELQSQGIWCLLLVPSSTSMHRGHIHTGRQSVHTHKAFTKGTRVRAELI